MSHDKLKRGDLVTVIDPQGNTWTREGGVVTWINPEDGQSIEVLECNGSGGMYPREWVTKLGTS
jgi:hypothetical protein